MIDNMLATKYANQYKDDDYFELILGAIRRDATWLTKQPEREPNKSFEPTNRFNSSVIIKK